MTPDVTIRTPEANDSPSAVRYSDVTAGLMAVEERLRLFDRRIGGVHFWEYLRLRVHYEITRTLDLLTFEPFHRTPSRAERIRRIADAASAVATGNPFLSPPGRFLFFGYPRRVRQADGLYHDLHLDPLLAKFPHPHLYVEPQLPATSRGRSGTTRGLRRHVVIDVAAYLHRRFSPFILSAADALLIREIEAELHREFGARIEIAGLASAILHRRQSLVSVYCGLFQKLRPPLVVVLSPNCAEVAAVEVAKELGIPTAEIQHGSFGPHDPSYAFPRNAGRVRHFCDHLLVYGDFWKEGLTQLPPGTQVTSIGFAHFDAGRAARQHRPDGDKALFLSQATIGAALSKLAVEVARQDRWRGRVVYRLHPDECEGAPRYPWLAEAGVVVESHRDVPLYESFAAARAQVGVYSAAIFEGAALGLRTFLADLPGVELMAPLIARGWAAKITSADEIDDGLNHLPLASDMIYRRDAARNFATFCDQFVAQPRATAA